MITKTKKGATPPPAKKPTKASIAAARRKAQSLVEAADSAQLAANKAQHAANIARHKACLASIEVREMAGAITGDHIDYDSVVGRLNRSIRSSASALTLRITNTRKDLLYYYEFARNADFGK